MPLDATPNGRQNKSHKLYSDSLYTICFASHETINNKLEGGLKPNQVIYLEIYGWGEEALLQGKWEGVASLRNGEA